MQRVQGTSIRLSLARKNYFLTVNRRVNTSATLMQLYNRPVCNRWVDREGRQQQQSLFTNSSRNRLQSAEPTREEQEQERTGRHMLPMRETRMPAYRPMVVPIAWSEYTVTEKASR